MRLPTRVLSATAAVLFAVCAGLADARAARAQELDPKALVVPPTQLGPLWFVIRDEKAPHSYSAEYRNNYPRKRGASFSVTLDGAAGSLTDARQASLEAEGYTFELSQPLGDGKTLKGRWSASAGVSFVYLFRVGAAFAAVTVAGAVDQAGEVETETLRYALLQRDRLRAIAAGDSPSTPTPMLEPQTPASPLAESNAVMPTSAVTEPNGVMPAPDEDVVDQGTGPDGE